MDTGESPTWKCEATLTDVEEAEVLGTILPEHIKTEEESGD